MSSYLSSEIYTLDEDLVRTAPGKPPVIPLFSKRHYGPGAHPGTGTDQSVHAGGREGAGNGKPKAKFWSGKDRNYDQVYDKRADRIINEALQKIIDRTDIKVGYVAFTDRPSIFMDKFMRSEKEKAKAAEYFEARVESIRAGYSNRTVFINTKNLEDVPDEQYLYIITHEIGHHYGRFFRPVGESFPTPRNSGGYKGEIAAAGYGIVEEFQNREYIADLFAAYVTGSEGNYAFGREALDFRPLKPDEISDMNTLIDQFKRQYDLVGRARGETVLVFFERAGEVVEYSASDVVDLDEDEEGIVIVERGGPGSGHYDHDGRPGEVGGSLPSGDAPSWSAGRHIAVDGYVLWNGKYGELVDQWALEVDGEMATNFHEHPDNAVAEFEQSQIEAEAQRAKSEKRRKALDRLLAPDSPTEDDLRAVHRYEHITKSNAVGLMRELGLRWTDATNIFKKLPSAGVNKYGSSYVRVEDVISSVREFLEIVERGGPGSGYHDPHYGRPGEVGGSLPREAGAGVSMEGITYQAKAGDQEYESLEEAYEAGQGWIELTDAERNLWALIVADHPKRELDAGYTIDEIDLEREIQIALDVYDHFLEVLSDPDNATAMAAMDRHGQFILNGVAQWLEEKGEAGRGRRPSLNILITNNNDRVGAGSSSVNSRSAKVFWQPLTLDVEKWAIESGGMAAAVHPVYVLTHELHHGFGSGSELDVFSEVVAFDYMIRHPETMGPATEKSMLSDIARTVHGAARRASGEFKDFTLQDRAAAGWLYSRHKDYLETIWAERMSDEPTNRSYGWYGETYRDKLERWAKEYGNEPD